MDGGRDHYFAGRFLQSVRDRTKQHWRTIRPLSGSVVYCTLTSNSARYAWMKDCRRCCTELYSKCRSYTFSIGPVTIIWTTSGLQTYKSIALKGGYVQNFEISLFSSRCRGRYTDIVCYSFRFETSHSLAVCNTGDAAWYYQAYRITIFLFSFSGRSKPYPYVHGNIKTRFDRIYIYNDLKLFPELPHTSIRSQMNGPSP